MEKENQERKMSNLNDLAIMMFYKGAKFGAQLMQGYDFKYLERMSFDEFLSKYSEEIVDTFIHSYSGDEKTKEISQALLGVHDKQ